MNEKEAREILRNPSIDIQDEALRQEAKGYLEAIKKAKVLVEALKVGLLVAEESLEYGASTQPEIELIEEALAKWEKGK